jgi:predicted 3-demethylubiquinone-9 3-methyltransferase (glyoxalase superfamily)
MPKITPCLWFDGQLEEAVQFYLSVFDDARILSINPMMAMFEIEGQRFMGLDGRPKLEFTEAVSFMIGCETQDEVDRYWNGLIAGGGAEGQCGGLKDRCGVSGLVVPRALGRLLADPDRARAQRTVEAMMRMRKLDIAELERAAGS